MQNSEPPRLVDAFRDIRGGWQRHELWLTLGWRDILTRYRRSKLGAMWIPLSMLIVASVMGTLYSAIMQKPSDEYIPYLLVGFMAWMLLQSILIDGTHVFAANASAIKEIPIPLSVYVYRTLWRNLIVFLYNCILYAFAVLYFRMNIFPEIAMVIPGLVLVMLNGLWIGLLFGLINARHRDFHQMINSLMRLIFFVTPIIWFVDSVSGLRHTFALMNPFYYFVEIIRAPLLGQLPSLHVLSVTGIITLVGWVITIPVYMRWRQKIPYWV